MTILNDTGEKMKSDVLKITKDEASLSALIAETKKAAEYANLGAKEALRLSLLAEELIGMLPELLGYSDGSFWIESEGKKFDLDKRQTVGLKWTAEIDCDNSVEIFVWDGDHLDGQSAVVTVTLEAEFDFSVVELECFHG